MSINRPFIIFIILLITVTLVFGNASCGNVSADSTGSDPVTDKASASGSQKTEIKTVWYSVKDCKLALKVPSDIKIRRTKKNESSYSGENKRVRITIKRWNQVSYPTVRSLARLAKKHTGRDVKKIWTRGLRMVKVKGYKTKIKYYIIAPSGDDYILTIKPINGKKLKDIKAETDIITKSLRSSSRIPKGAERIKLSKTKDPDTDYLVLVNSRNKLPKKWSSKVDIVKAVNSMDKTIKAERRAYKAYLKLKRTLEKEDKIHIDIDYGLRTVKEQQALIDEYTRKYGSAYANRIAAKPGYSEHHTGLALDIYLIINGKEVYLNEEMEKYPKTWKKIHNRLADYGFILRYPKGSVYPYEPWHIRYVGKKAAKKIMANLPMTLEKYLGKG